MSKFDWKTNILIKRDLQTEVPLIFGPVMREWMYTENRCDGLGFPELWFEDELIRDLSGLPDEELKAAMFYQPLLCPVIVSILKQRDNTMRRRTLMKKLMTALGLTLLVVAICFYLTRTS